MTAQPPIKNIRLRGWSFHSMHIRADRFELFADNRMPAPCPGYNGESCVETIDYWPPTKAEPDTGTAAWGGGYRCDCCGFVCEDEPKENSDD